jgi:hypothetical protein
VIEKVKRKSTNPKILYFEFNSSLPEFLPACIQKEAHCRPIDAQEGDLGKGPSPR